MSTFLLWGIGILFLLLCVTVLSLLFYSGLLYPIRFKAGKPPVGRLHVAYKFGRGEYSNVGLIFSELTKLVPSTYRCLGMYYDDPEKVPTDERRYIVGAILSEGDDEPDKELEAKLISSGYKIHDMPAVSNMVYTTFPNKSFLSLVIAIYRVFPAFVSYIEEAGLSAHPLFEIYDGDIIYYLGPLAKQDQFYVPEAKEKPKKDPDAENTRLSTEESADEENNSGIDGNDGSDVSSRDGGSVSSFEELDASQVTEHEVHEESEEKGDIV